MMPELTPEMEVIIANIVNNAMKRDELVIDIDIEDAILECWPLIAAQEREACAKVADEHGRKSRLEILDPVYNDGYGDGSEMAGMAIAAAIRRRGEA